MKRVRINAGKIGLVFRHGDYHRVLTEGIHWVGFRESVTLYNTALSFTSNTIDLEVFLRDEALVALWHVIDVLDHELVIVYKNKKYTLKKTNLRKSAIFIDNLTIITHKKNNTSGG